MITNFDIEIEKMLNERENEYFNEMFEEEKDWECLEEMNEWLELGNSDEWTDEESISLYTDELRRKYFRKYMDFQVKIVDGIELTEKESNRELKMYDYFSKFDLETKMEWDRINLERIKYGLEN